MQSNFMSRRQFLKVSALTGGVLALSGCVPAAAPAGGGEAAAPAAGGEAAAAPAAEGQTISYWHGWGNLDPAMAKIVETDEWKAHSNGATLEYKGSVNGEAMLTAIAGGTPPDAHSNHDYVNYFTRGAVIEVSDMAASSNIVKKDNILDWVWEYSFFDGKMIGVPGIESYVQYGLNVNADLAKQAGMDPANLPTTWSEVMDWHKALTKKDDAGNLGIMGLDPHDAMGGDVDFQPLSYGVTWYDEKTKEFHLDDERIVKMLQDTAEFVKVAGPDQFAGLRGVEGNGQWGGAVEAGVQAMIVEGYWHPGEAMIRKPEIGKHNVAGWAPVSDDRKGTKMQGVNAHFVQIFKDAKNQAGAFKLGEFFNTVKACEIIFKEVGWVHGVKEYIPTIDANAFPGLKFYIDSGNEATEWHLLRRCPIHWAVKTQLDAVRDQIARDQITAEEAAANLQKFALEEWENQGLSK